MEYILELIQTILIITVIYLLLKKSDSVKPGVSSGKGGRKLVLDTSAIIDGRILEVANAGFAPSQLIIPRFIVNELQLIADSQDPHKRERARFGLDVVQELKDNLQSIVVVSQHDITDDIATDDKLVKLARKIGADLCTTDYNLNKVAQIEGVKVLNLNELANAVRPVALPGEKKRVKIVQRGSNKDQGVGYMEDGSMIVVEGASRAIGKHVDVQVSRYIQTDAGKMLFAKKLGSPKRVPAKKD